MTKVVGVRFRQVGKIYFFAPGKYSVETGQHVIVETARGVEYGQVVLGEREVEDTAVIQPLKAIIRVATPEDDERELKNREKEKEAFKICLEKIAKHNLDMKLIKAEYTFDNNKVLFYFTADGRIDFRELVKDLAAVFKTRIELRQIGVRDETKILGGIGSCGRPLCCATFLPEFNPVSIKMAKEQNVKVLITHDNDEKELKEYPVEELRFKRKRRFDKVRIDDDKELKALEELERKEGKAHISDD